MTSARKGVISSPHCWGAQKSDKGGRGNVPFSLPEGGRGVSSVRLTGTNNSQFNTASTFPAVREKVALGEEIEGRVKREGSASTQMTCMGEKVRDDHP